MIRTFIAVEVNDEIRPAISRRQDEVKDRLSHDLRKLAPDARLQWTHPESIHLTLKFLGEIDESQIERICAALNEVADAASPLSLEIGGLGAFPDARAPRVLWLGLADPAGSPQQIARLTHAAGDLDRALRSFGFESESKTYSPHLTLARIKAGSREVGRALTDSGALMHSESIGILRIDGLSLMRSDLKPSGSVYTRLCYAQFRGSLPMFHEVN